MLDIGWAELMVIGVVALVVIGPKDLPDMFRQLGRFMAKIRGMGRDFQRAMDEAARQSGVSEVAKDLKGATSAKAMGLDGLRSAADKFEKWDPIKNAARPTVVPKPATALTTTPVAMPPVAMTPVAMPPVAKMGNPAGMPATPALPMTAAPLSAASSLTPAATLTEAGSAAVTEAAPEKLIGPETQALIDRQAAKAAALRDYTAKLKAIDAGTLSPIGVVPPPDEPQVAAEVVAVVAVETPKPPRKPRVRAVTPDAGSDAISQPKPQPKPRRAEKKIAAHIKADDA